MPPTPENYPHFYDFLLCKSVDMTVDKHFSRVVLKNTLISCPLFFPIFCFFTRKITIAIFTTKDNALMPFLLTYAQNIAISKQNHVFGQKFLVWVIVWVIALNG